LFFICLFVYYLFVFLFTYLFIFDTGADIQLFDWFVKHHDKKYKICGMLDTQESFLKVASHFNMEDFEIQKLKERPGKHPTADEVMVYINSLKPKLLVSEFIDCTDCVGRNDVSEVLKDAIRSEQQQVE